MAYGYSLLPGIAYRLSGQHHFHIVLGANVEHLHYAAIFDCLVGIQGHETGRILLVGHLQKYGERFERHRLRPVLTRGGENRVV